MHPKGRDSRPISDNVEVFVPEIAKNRWVVLAAGWSLIALGVLGLFLPFLQGILFLLAGLLVLSREYTWARRLLSYLRTRFPRLGLVMDAASEKVARWSGQAEKQTAVASESSD